LIFFSFSLVTPIIISRTKFFSKNSVSWSLLFWIKQKVHFPFLNGSERFFRDVNVVRFIIEGVPLKPTLSGETNQVTSLVLAAYNSIGQNNMRIAHVWHNFIHAAKLMVLIVVRESVYQNQFSLAERDYFVVAGGNQT